GDGLAAACEAARGEDVTVGVIDTGIDDSHQVLSGQVAGGYDASGTGETDGTTSMGPDPNHGTMVASLIAGHGHGELPETEDEDDSEDEDSDYDPDDEASEELEEVAPIDEYGTEGILGTAPEVTLIYVS